MNIKKIAAVMCAALCAATTFAVDIETALQQVADQFSASLKKGTTIAIVGISSDSAEMSNFILDEITLDFVKQHKLTVANRANLDAIKKEMNFQLSGEVSEESIQQLGAMVGANVVIHGNIKPLGRNFNLVVQALDVTSATVLDMIRIRVEPNDITDELFAQDGVSRKTPPVSKSAGRSKRDHSTSKYSGDFQIQLGWRFVEGGGDIGKTGFLLGGRNFNLFNINDTISMGFFEDLSGSMFGNWGVNFIMGPALGINIKDIVKFVIAPGLSIGVDYGSDHDYNSDSHYSSDIFGFAINVTVKFIPSKAVSPFISFQYDLKSGYYYRYYYRYYNYSYDYHTYEGECLLSAFNISAGISFNFGRRH